MSARRAAGRRAGQQRRGHGLARHQRLERREVLLGERLGRRHQRRLACRARPRAASRRARRPSCPSPTSPISSRCIGCSCARSPMTESIARCWSPVGSNGSSVSSQRRVNPAPPTGALPAALERQVERRGARRPRGGARGGAAGRAGRAAARRTPAGGARPRRRRRARRAAPPAGRAAGGGRAGARAAARWPRARAAGAPARARGSASTRARRSPGSGRRRRRRRRPRSSARARSRGSGCARRTSRAARAACPAGYFLTSHGWLKNAAFIEPLSSATTASTIGRMPRRRTGRELIERTSTATVACSPCSSSATVRASRVSRGRCSSRSPTVCRPSAAAASRCLSPPPVSARPAFSAAARGPRHGAASSAAGSGGGGLRRRRVAGGPALRDRPLLGGQQPPAARLPALAELELDAVRARAPRSRRGRAGRPRR